MHVCLPGRRVSLRDVRVHNEKQFERRWHKRLPVTPPAQTLLDIAAQVRFRSCGVRSPKPSSSSS